MTPPWRDFADHIKGQLAPGGHLRQISGLANKLPEHAARIAAVLALFDDLDATEVSEEHLRRGIEIVQFHLKEAIRLLGVSQVSAELADAQTLLDWLHGWTDPHTKAAARHVSIRALCTYGPASIRDTATAKRLVGTLVEHGWLQPVNGATVAGKSSRRAWEIVRAGA